MKKVKKPVSGKPPAEGGKTDKRRLTVEELEKRIAPAVTNKKDPVPPPYPAGAYYGLMRRANLSR